MSSHIKSWSY